MPPREIQMSMRYRRSTTPLWIRCSSMSSSSVTVSPTSAGLLPPRNQGQRNSWHSSTSRQPARVPPGGAAHDGIAGGGFLHRAHRRSIEVALESGIGGKGNPGWSSTPPFAQLATRSRRQPPDSIARRGQGSSSRRAIVSYRVAHRGGRFHRGLVAFPSSHKVPDSSLWLPLVPTCLLSIFGPFLMTWTSAIPWPRPSP